MTDTNDNNTPDFSDLGYSAQGLHQIWDDVKPLLREHGGLCSDDIHAKLDAGKYGYHKKSIRHGILPRMREALDNQGFISTKEQAGEHEKIVKKLWILQD